MEGTNAKVKEPPVEAILTAWEMARKIADDATMDNNTKMARIKLIFSFPYGTREREAKP